MGRHLKEYSLRENGYSLKAYIDGEYVGSVNKRKLCEAMQVIREKKLQNPFN